ncbi:hypothetical protein [uncultured Muriicola sp.]|uniref:hypothetical protein n=1 Tax=uncultured Muriicola sp. TaxID=1583102 RepID=UPI002620D2B8|nr:hypothetical protein [uncultured Muriicola sp.]
MKALLTLFLVLFLSAVVFAQKQEDHAKIEYHQMDTFLDSRPAGTISGRENKKVATQKIARLYRFKNARIQKELAFKTKKQYFTV